MDIVARWPGSVHDSTMFNNSRVKYLLESQQLGKSCRLGDRGYALKKYLLVPLADPQTPAEKLYIESQIQNQKRGGKSIWCVDEEISLCKISIKGEIKKYAAYHCMHCYTA